MEKNRLYIFRSCGIVKARQVKKVRREGPLPPPRPYAGDASSLTTAYAAPSPYYNGSMRVFQDLILDPFVFVLGICVCNSVVWGYYGITVLL